jgi:flagellar motor component MotA
MGIVLGITIASFLFLPLLFTLKMREKQQSKGKLILGIGMLSAIAMSLGIMFKIMHWPGANMMGMGAVLAMVFVFLPIYFFTGIRNPETKVNTIVSSLVIILGSGLFFTLINTRPSATIERTNVLANLHTQNSYECALKQNALSYETVSKDSTLKQLEINKLRTACAKLYSSIEDLKLKLISACEGVEMKKVDYNNFYASGEYSIPTNMMFD